jgi:hypothetical protein
LLCPIVQTKIEVRQSRTVNYRFNPGFPGFSA